MSTRREFLTQTGAAGAVLATSVAAALAADDGAINSKSPIEAQRAASASTLRIKAVIPREETTLRLGGDGDNWHMSWAADDRQLVALCDGMGWSENPKALYNSRLFAISGDPHNASFHDIPGYPEKLFRDRVNSDHKPTAYYSFGTLAIDGHIYQFLSTPDTQPFLRFVGAKLIYSPDNGRTWRNQDGSTPVVWETSHNRSRDNMAFFEEPQDAFSLLTILQMGRNYENNRDGYVYVYSPNGSTEGTMNELVMFRVPKAKLLHRGAYEYFAGVRPNGTATWVNDIHRRTAVHTFPVGWVNRNIHPYAWHPSVVYNAPLGLYMMANWATGIGTGTHPISGAKTESMWFMKPSYLGFWVAPQPWGPWTQIHEDTAWTPANDREARAYQPQIAPKWIAKDGKSFWLVWTDFQHTSEFWPTAKKALSAQSHDEFMRLMLQSRQHRPYYAFNTQRVDLVVT